MQTITLDDITVNCDSIQSLGEALRKELVDGQKKLERLEEDERKLRRRVRKLQTLLEGKPSVKKPASAASI